MKPLFPALAASTALHAAVLAVAVSRPALPRPPPSHVPVDVEVFVMGPQQPLGPPMAVRAPSHEVTRRVRKREPALAPVPAVAAVDGVLPMAIAKVPEAHALPLIASAPSAAAVAPKASDLDLSAFYERLQHAAQRCSGPRAGEGKIRFCVGADGAPTEVSLVQSTGNFALDDAAVNCVIPGAAPFPRTDRCLVVPLRFQ